MSASFFFPNEGNFMQLSVGSIVLVAFVVCVHELVLLLQLIGESYLIAAPSLCL